MPRFYYKYFRIPQTLLIASATSVLLHGVVLASIFDFSPQSKTDSDTSTKLIARLVAGKNNGKLPQATAAVVTESKTDQTRSHLPSELTSKSPERERVAIIHLQPVSQFRTSAQSESDPNNLVEIRKIYLPYFFPSVFLDRAPYPVSAPNPREYLLGTEIPAIPIRLRLFIDEMGKVVIIERVDLEYLDERLTDPIKRMFFATSFIPGNRKGKDVPSHIDIEVELADYIR